MKIAVTGTLIAAAVLFFTTAFGLALIHITDFPYTADIDYLNITESAGMSRDEILMNYNAIMDFLSPFSDKEFKLPTISYTEKAGRHFADCKPLFDSVYFLGATSALILAILAVKKPIGRRTLKVSGAITLAIPALLVAAVAIDFDRTFNLFHKVFFEGETWLFDPEVDNFIKIMPMEFFMHCAIFIALFWVLGAAVQMVIGCSNRKACKF